MHLRDISFLTPQENIAFDEVLLALAEKQQAGEYLRFWESSTVFIVLGLTGRPQWDVNATCARGDNIPVLKRSSGGGTVLQGPGCLNYTLVLSKQEHPQLNDLRGSYQWISSKVIQALDQAGVKSFFRTPSDVAAGPDEKKFSGNAQRRSKHYIMHHGTILYNFDLPLISRYLQVPREIPEYRQGRPHEDFVVNIPIDPQIFKNKLAKIFHTSDPKAPTQQELAMLRQWSLPKCGYI